MLLSLISLLFVINVHIHTTLFFPVKKKTHLKKYKSSFCGFCSVAFFKLFVLVKKKELNEKITRKLFFHFVKVLK